MMILSLFLMCFTKMWLITICFVGYSHGYGYYVYNTYIYSSIFWCVTFWRLWFQPPRQTRGFVESQSDLNEQEPCVYEQILTMHMFGRHSHLVMLLSLISIIGALYSHWSNPHDWVNQYNLSG